MAAVALMIGFYVLVVVVAGALLYVVYAEVRYLGRLYEKLTLGCLAAAGTLLWSARPRVDRFEAPGPLLDEEEQPELFREIRLIASKVGQEPPADVYLDTEVNAAVAVRNGVMGFFGRRVMVLGLPLLHSLSVSELRAVLSHEFGHFDHGDTVLGAWTHKVDAAIRRSVHELKDNAVAVVFRIYALLFLRVTHAISRSQELAADQIAAKIAGPDALVSSLTKVATTAPLFRLYWAAEVEPVVRSGYRPPIAEGFEHFVTRDGVRSEMDKLAARATQPAETSAMDTHPPLAVRVAAVAGATGSGLERVDQRAITLLRDVRTLESQLIDWARVPRRRSGGRVTRYRLEELEDLPWESVVEAALLPRWREEVAKQTVFLRGASVGALADAVAGSAERIDELRLNRAQQRLPEAAKRELALHTLSLATIVALDRKGWRIESMPGEPVSATRRKERLRPVEIVRKLASDASARAAWTAEAERLGIADLALA